MRPSMVGTTMAWVMPSAVGRGRPTRSASKAGRYTMRRPLYTELRTADMPGDVVRRDADELGLVVVGAEELDAAEDVRRQVAVAQDRRLGFARRAAGEEQHRDLFRIDERQVVARRRRRSSCARRSSVREQLDAVDAGMRSSTPRRRPRAPAPGGRGWRAGGRRSGGSSPGRTGIPAMPAPNRHSGTARS